MPPSFTINYGLQFHSTFQWSCWNLPIFLDTNPYVLIHIFSMCFTSMFYLKVMVNTSGYIDAMVKGIFHIQYKRFVWEKDSGSQKIYQTDLCKRLQRYIFCK